MQNELLALLCYFLALDQTHRGDPIPRGDIVAGVALNLKRKIHIPAR